MEKKERMDDWLQERTEEVALDRTPVTQGLLRVKKEEELQEAPSCGGGPTILTTPGLDSDGIRLPCREVEAAATARNVVAPFLIGSRRTSPPPEDWKPLDKCYFCLDGKLPHDDQPPLVSTRFSSSGRALKEAEKTWSWSHHGDVDRHWETIVVDSSFFFFSCRSSFF